MTAAAAPGTTGGTVRLDVDGPIATITLDRPAARNAIDRAMAQQIADALDELDNRDDLAVGVLTAIGPVFSAGMDLKAFASTGERPVVPGRGAFGIVHRPPVKPLVAAVEGLALGGGFEIVLACDLLVAGREARFGLPEVKRGLVAAAGGVLRLPRRISRSGAMAMVLTGDPIDGATAERWGLVNELVEPGQALAAAQRLARKVADNAPLALRTAKHLLDAGLCWRPDEAFALQEPLVEAVRRSADAAEGAQAFVEKRVPRWTGR
ncbi:crotonase/enoyl-CoA hydratase family protein [Nocardia vaccinii]|uniref:crotonase/enoyl-CoA hydratase family protein n=1 Tax=Nocardia vaccinii TaxID=1822 RepID=UPI00082D9BC1|nr:crotonase/enoyl-CoA hydratase family protein [Nocardia vaccinii]